MRTTAVSVAGGLTAAAVLLLSACGSSGSSANPSTANTASCEAALVQQLKDAKAGGASATPNPAGVLACAGLPAATLLQLESDAIHAVFGSLLPTAMPNALPSGLPSDLPSALPTDLGSLLPTSN